MSKIRRFGAWIPAALFVFAVGCGWSFGETDEGGVVFTLKVNPIENEAPATQKMGAVLEERMNRMGTSLGQVAVVADDTLQVLVPKSVLLAEDPSRLFQSVNWSVYEVAEDVTVPPSWKGALIAANEVVGQTTLEKMSAALEGVEPPIGQLKVGWNVPDKQNEWVRLVPLRGQPIITHEHIVDATFIQDPQFPAVRAQLNSKGAVRLAQASGRLVDHKIALVLNGEVLSDPIVREAITGGRVHISMGNGPEADHEARVLAGIFASKPLPGTLTVEGIEPAPPGTKLSSTHSK